MKVRRLRLRNIQQSGQHHEASTGRARILPGVFGQQYVLAVVAMPPL